MSKYDVTINGLHMGRAWSGHELEDRCQCPQAPCGLVISDRATGCGEHGFDACKTMRQIHRAENCPGGDD